MSLYFYIANGEQRGPISIEELQKMGISSTTKVWKEGMADWQPAGEVEEITAVISFGCTPPPVTPPVVPPVTAQATYNGTVNQTFQSQPQENKPPKPDTYLVWSILVTILCCLPFGIPAIVYASRVDNQYFQGQYDAAYNSSKQAKTWTIVSAACGLVFAVIYFIYAFAVGAAMMSM